MNYTEEDILNPGILYIDTPPFINPREYIVTDIHFDIQPTFENDMNRLFFEDTLRWNATFEFNTNFSYDSTPVDRNHDPRRGEE